MVDVYVDNVSGFLEYFTVQTSALRNTLLNKGYITCNTTSFNNYDPKDGFVLNKGIIIKEKSNVTGIDVYVKNAGGLLECFTATTATVVHDILLYKNYIVDVSAASSVISTTHTAYVTESTDSIVSNIAIQIAISSSWTPTGDPLLEVYVEKTNETVTSFLGYFTTVKGKLRNILLNKGYITCNTTSFSDYALPDGFILNTDIKIKKNANGSNFDVYVGNTSGLLECFTAADGDI